MTAILKIVTSPSLTETYSSEISFAVADWGYNETF